MPLDYLSDNLVELRGPVNIAQNAAVAESSTVSAKLYDTELDARLSDAPTVLREDYTDTSSLDIIVRNALFMHPGAQILVKTKFGSIIQEEVVSKSTIDGVSTITLTNALGTPADKGAPVVTLVYGTGAGFIQLDNIEGWKNDMTMEITHSDGTLAEFTVGNIDAEDSHLWLRGQTLGVTTLAGALIKHKVGPASIAMVAFGSFPTSNPVIGDPAWGFRGVIEYNAQDLLLGMRVRAEITLVDGVPVPDLNLTRKVIGTLINR